MRETFDASGPLASIDALAAVCGIGRRGESGTLRVTGPAGESVRFGFAEGVLVALDPPPDSGPADVLIRGGKVQRATYEALTVGDFEDRFAVAAASGVISRREANWGLKISAIETLVRLLSWGDGEYSWEEGAPEPTAPPLKLRIDQWVLELFLRSNDRGFVVRKIGPPDVPVARAEGFAESFAALGLTADADAVVEGVDGRRTIDEIVRRSRADEFATLKLLAALITLGLVLPIHEIPETAGDDSAPTTESDFAPASIPDSGAAPEELAALEPDEFELATPAGSASEETPEPEPAPEPAAEPEASAPSAEREPPEAPWEPEAIEAPDAAFERVEAGSSEPPPPESEAENAAPSPEPLPLPDISVPLFALTAPEPEASPEPEPAPDDSFPSGAGDLHRSQGGLRAAALLAALALVGILILVRRREASPRQTAPPSAAASPGAPARPAPGPAATEPPPRRSPPVTEPAPERTPDRVAAAPTPKKSASPERRPKKAEAEAASPARNDSWDALARTGRKTFEHPGVHRYAIQLELACEGSTLQKAFAADPERRQIWLSSYSFRGRSCYRVLWGKYRDLDSAKAAKSTVPEFFSRDGNHPTVVPLGRAK